jgi:hypothetical protein
MTKTASANAEAKAGSGIKIRVVNMVLLKIGQKSTRFNG